MNRTKTERILFSAAAVVFALLAVMLFALLRGRGKENTAVPVSGIAATPVPGPDAITIGGKRVSPGTDTFFLNSTPLSDADRSAISSLTGLTTLSLTGCSIQDTGFLTPLTGLTTLYLSDNAITDITPLTGLHSLRTLYLDNNPVSQLSGLTALTQLSTLSLKGIPLKDYELEDLRAAMPACSIFDSSTVDSARPIVLGGVSFTSEDTVLDLSGRGITDISKLAYCDKLTELNLSGNPLSGVGVLTQLSSLRVLNLSSTGLSDSLLSVVQGIRGLQWLMIYDNPALTAEAIDQLKAALPACVVNHDEVFYKVRLADTELSSDMTAVFLPSRSIGDISALDTFERLAAADFSDNKLTSLSAVRSWTHLQQANFEKNYIADLSPFANHPELTELDLSDNRITDITALGSCPALQTLDLSNNNVSYVSHLAACTSLRWLDLRGNPMLSADSVEALRLYLPACEILTDLPEPTPEPTVEPIPELPAGGGGEVIPTEPTPVPTEAPPPETPVPEAPVPEAPPA